MRYRRLALVLLTVTLSWCADARGAAGDLDPSFSGDGVVALRVGSFVARTNAVDPAGRIVVGGYACEPDPEVRDGTCLDSGGSSFRLARLTPDGGLDPEFGLGGFVATLDLGDGRSQAQDLLVLEDGSIIVGGVAVSGGRDVFALVKYTPDGSLDPAFGTGGKVLQPIGSDYALLSDLARGPGGSILAAGQALDAGGQPRIAVARFTPTGTLDTTFGAGGSTLGSAAPFGFGLAIDAWPDGGVIAGGITGASSVRSAFRFGELRLDPGGTPTAGFGTAGATQHEVGKSSGFVNAVVALPQSTWVSAGPAYVDGGDRDRSVMAVTRGTPAGTLDPRFGTRGVALVPTPGDAIANDLVVGYDGKPLAIGQTELDGAYVFTTARLLANGLPDPTYGRNGIAAVPFGRFPVARATSGALQLDGRLVTVGIGCDGGTGPRCEGGTAVLLAARQLTDDPAPGAGPRPSPSPAPAPQPRPVPQADGAPRIGVKAAGRISRQTLRRRGVRLRVQLSEVARLDARLVGRRPGRRARVVLDRVRVRDPRGSFRLRLRGRARVGNAELVVRATDSAGNTRVKRVRLRVVR